MQRSQPSWTEDPWTALLGVEPEAHAGADGNGDRAGVLSVGPLPPRYSGGGPRATRAHEAATSWAAAAEAGGPGFATLPAAAWAEGQRVCWAIKGLGRDQVTREVNYRGVRLPGGKYIASPSFNMAGEEASLRFWPNGHFSGSQKRERSGQDLAGLRADSWCTLGLFMPAGTRLRLRFFVGDAHSDVRECFWSGGGSLVHQLWTPDEQTAPNSQDITVGVEVLRDLRQHRPTMPTTCGSSWCSKASPRRSPNGFAAGQSNYSRLGVVDGVAGGVSIRTAAGLVLPSPRFAHAGRKLQRESMHPVVPTL